MAYHYQEMLNIRDVCWTPRNFVWTERFKREKKMVSLWTFQLKYHL